MRFSLSHLNPKYLEFYGQKVQKTLKLKVLYSDHCFTARVNRSVSDSERVFSIEIQSIKITSKHHRRAK